MSVEACANHLFLPRSQSQTLFGPARVQETLFRVPDTTNHDVGKAGSHQKMRSAQSQVAFYRFLSIERPLLYSTHGEQWRMHFCSPTTKQFCLRLGNPRRVKPWRVL